MGIEPADIERLNARHHLFAAHKDAFAEYFYRIFLDIPDTRVILEQQENPEVLKKAWSNWFAYIFGSGAGDSLVDYLWRVGARHVEVNLDHRYSNVGFSVIRRYCHDIIGAEVRPDERVALLRSVDKLLDLCLLVETDAYIESTARCDLEVMREVADRVRNPAMIIGGNIKRLQRKAAVGSNEYDVYNRLMFENDRLEGMVRDIKVYMELFQGEPSFGPVDLSAVISWALEKLQPENGPRARVELDLDPAIPVLNGDTESLQYLFFYLLENSLDAVDPETGYIRISSASDPTVQRNTRIEIFNTGVPPKPEEIEKLFNPFYSTKPEGSGFGLPIARLVARKHYGKITMQASDGEGTLVTVTLPRRE